MESNGKYVLFVFNTCTQKYEEVVVTEEVYRAYWQEVEHARWLEKQARSREISWQGVSGMPDHMDDHQLVINTLAEFLA